MSNPVSEEQRKRLEAGLQARINQLKNYKTQMHLVDQKVYNAGMDLFEDAAVLAYWLTRPATGLGGKVPLQLMADPTACAMVENLLRRIEYGVY